MIGYLGPERSYTFFAASSFYVQEELIAYKNIGRLLSRDHILSAVWGYDLGLNTRTVDTHMSRIRKKLDIVPEKGWRLSSIYHQGYRLEHLVHSSD
jgi:DNA-binding response OmpR family regulator